MKTAVLKMSIMLAASTFILMGCSGFDNNGQLSSDIVSETSLESLNKSLDEVEQQTTDVNSQLSKMSLEGLSYEALTGLEKSFVPTLENLLGVAFGSVAKVDELREELKKKLTLLNFSNPKHKELMDKINGALSYLDKLRDELRNRLIVLKNKINVKMQQIDERVAKLDMSKPASWVIVLAWESVKVKIQEKLSLIDQIKI